jgi:hypothetical protein
MTDRKTETAEAANDNPEITTTISATDLAVALGLNEDAFLQRVAGVLVKRGATDILSEIVGPIAPPGWRWRCGACGKTARDRFGEERGWNESCMLNSFLEKAIINA